MPTDGGTLWNRHEPPRDGCFVSPTLLVARDAEAEVLHELEVFGPVATIIPYDGSADAAVDLVNPPWPTRRRSKRYAKATIVQLRCAHMSFTEEPHRTQILESSLEFLDAQLGSREVE